MINARKGIYKFYTNVGERIGINDFNLYIAKRVYFLELAALRVRTIDHLDADICKNISIYQFDAKVSGTVILNDFDIAVKFEYLPIRLTCYGAVVLVDDDLFKFNLLRTRADERQGGENDGQKQCFHSVQMLLKGF